MSLKATNSGHRDLHPDCSRRFGRRQRDPHPLSLCSLRRVVRLVRQQLFLKVGDVASQLLRAYEAATDARTQLGVEQHLIAVEAGGDSQGNSTERDWRKIQINLRETMVDARAQATKCATYVADFTNVYLKEPHNKLEINSTAEKLKRSCLDAVAIEDNLARTLKDIRNFMKKYFHDIQTRSTSSNRIISEVELMIASAIEPIPPLSNQMELVLHRSLLPGFMGVIASILPSDTVLLLDEVIQGKANQPSVTEETGNGGVEVTNNSSWLKCFLGVGHNVEMDLQDIAHTESSQHNGKDTLSAQKRRLAIKLYTVMGESLLRFAEILAERDADNIGRWKRFRRGLASKIIHPFGDRGNESTLRRR